MDNVSYRLENIFRDTFDDPTLAVRDNLTSADVGRWDSLGHVRLLAAVEREFNIRFTLDETVNIASVAALKQAVQSRTAGA